MNNDYQKKNKEQLSYLIKWYPHFGPTNIARDLNLSKGTVQQKAYRLNLKMLPQEERICYYCKKNKCYKQRGYRCHSCMKKMWNKYTQKSVDKNPLIKRLKNCLYAASKRAKQRNKDFDINLEFLIELWKKQDGKCFYSGIQLKAHNYGEGYRHLDSISIDKIDCRKGYTKDNIVLCSYYANLAKSELSVEEFILMCKKIAEYNNV